jgi:integrase
LVHDKAGASPSPTIGSMTYKFSTLIAEWARERNVQEKTRYGFERIIRKLVEHVGHDNAAAVTDMDVIGWKDALVASGLGPKTIKNHLMVVKTLFNFAKQNKRVAINVAADVSFRAHIDPRTKRLGYTDDDARRILIAARSETEPHLRWVPWLACFTGARLEEIVGAAVEDVEPIEGIPCLHIRLDNRDDRASLKNENSERTLPLHPAIVAEGFLEYVATLPQQGALFPNLTTDRFGKRAGSGTKRIGRWVRRKVGITDPRKAPSHSWRHWFKTACRKAGIEEEIHDALTGHGTGHVGRDYGDYVVGVLAPALEKVKSPMESARAVDHQ